MFLFRHDFASVTPHELFSSVHAARIVSQHFRVLYSHVCVMSSCSDNSIFQFYMRESSFPPAEVLAKHKRLYMVGMIKAPFESSAHLNSVPCCSFSESSSYEHS